MPDGLRRPGYGAAVKMTRWSLILAVGALALGACGSDDNSSAGSTAGEVAVTAVTDNTAALDTTAVSEPVDSATGDTTGDSTDDSVTDDTDPTAGGSLPVAAIDDKPVCTSFSRIITTSFFTGFAGSGAGDENSGIERVEVIAYSSLTADTATLRSEVPANLQPSLELLLSRVEAAPAALSAGGFSAAEIATIASAWNSVLDAVSAGTPLDEIPDATESLDQGKLDVAEAAFEAAVGTFDEYSAANDAAGSSMDDEGTAWLAETCPLLAKSLNDS